MDYDIQPSIDSRGKRAGVTTDEVPTEVLDALSEVLARVVDGALPLPMSNLTQTALHGEWLPDFREQLVDEGVNWTDAQPKVLDLAEQVGRYARILTLGKWVSAGGSLPTAVDTACAKLAGYLVASTSPNCLPVGVTGIRGKFCKGFSNPAGPARALELDELIRPLPRHSDEEDPNAAANQPTGA